MKMVTYTAIFAFLLIGSAHSQESTSNFETTAEGILQRLLPSTSAAENIPDYGGPNGSTSGEWNNAFDNGSTVKTRSFSISEPSKPPQHSEDAMAIKIYHREGDKEVWTTVVSPKKRTGRYLNLAVEFDVDSYELRQQSLHILNQLGTALADPRLARQTVYINGHTDSDGAADYNLRLSYNRAETVKKHLVKNFGISSERLLVRGYGEGMPLAPNNGKANKQLNRRVEIVAVGEPF